MKTGRMKRKAFSILLLTIALCACGGDKVVTEHHEVTGSIADSAVHYDDVPCSVRPDNVEEIAPKEVTREDIIQKANELYGVSEAWAVWLIGTTHNEKYQEDRYLEYAWACEIVNCYRCYSVEALDCIWGVYYSFSNAYAGYREADSTTLNLVWLALIEPDERIVEVDGMIRWEVPGYYLIYDSDVYNCQVWGCD